MAADIAKQVEVIATAAGAAEAGQQSTTIGLATGLQIDKIVVAIHGIGSQKRSDTIRSVARRFGDREEPPLPVMPLGYFTIGKTGDVRVSYLDAPDDSPLKHVGFAEVFWADIPRMVVKEEDTLEETKAWGASVVSRAHAAYNKKVKDAPNLTAEDFMLAANVVDEIIETVAVMENLFAVLDKMGVFKFDLAPLLRDYIGDVQIVADFKLYREKIVARFHMAIAQIVLAFQKLYPGRSPEIYIVAHSEGTVVSFLGLLQAMSGQVVYDPDAPGVAIDTSWIGLVRGFMTIGSPIDKHLVLWEGMWQGLSLASSRGSDGSVVFAGTSGVAPRALPKPIQWRNYYDFGDPIGFRLETAVAFLQKRHCVAFDFQIDKHDFGFSRYWLPGKAHNDYWNDPEVFGHFIEDVVMRSTEVGASAVPATPPTSYPLIGLASTSVPYALSAALHVTAVFVLYKAVTAFVTPEDSSYRPPPQHVALEIALLGLLLWSITIAARLPRLVKTNGLRWHLLALSAFVLGAAPSWLWLPEPLGQYLSQPFLRLATAVNAPADRAGVAAVLLTAAAVAISGWWVPRGRPRIGRKVLLGCGIVVVLAMMIGRLYEAEAHHPAWPVLLAGMAFLYLWWLGILLFDLAFVWHRYIRSSVAIRTLTQWDLGRDASAEVMPRLAGTKPSAHTAKAR